MRVSARHVAFGIFLFANPLAAQEHVHAAPSATSPAAIRLGTVHFPTSGSPAAQRAFLNGIALIHSFAYDAAARAFREAENADHNFALPYWFEALTHSPVLWGIDDAPAARQVLARLAPNASERLAKAATARERAYGSAVEAFFADADLPTRLRGFADSMVALARRDTTDLEASVFASLAQQMYLGRETVPQPEYDTRLADAIRFATRVFSANPQHPGAAHYLIHVSDVHPGPISRASPCSATSLSSRRARKRCFRPHTPTRASRLTPSMRSTCRRTCFSSSGSGTASVRARSSLRPVDPGKPSGSTRRRSGSRPTDRSRCSPRPCPSRVRRQRWRRRLSAARYQLARGGLGPPGAR